MKNMPTHEKFSVWENRTKYFLI